MSAVRPLRITARLRNNRMLVLIENEYESVAEFTRRNGFSAPDIYRLIGLAKSPARTNGEWTPTARRVAEALHVTPEILWPDELRRVLRTRVEAEIDVPDELQLPPSDPMQLLEAVNDKEFLAQAIESLPKREATVIRDRFGLDDGQEATLRASGAKIGLSAERTRQIELRALRRLRDVFGKRETGT